jgi:DNA replication protein DnaC
MSSAAIQTTTCPRCNGFGWVADTADSLRVEPCSCQVGLRRKQRLASAGIPKRYEHCTLATFRDREVGELVAAKRKVQDFVDVWPVRRRGLLLMGSPGSGKTHLAVAALHEIIKSDKPGRLVFANFVDLMLEIQASFDSNDVPTKSELLRPLLESDLLVLDELGQQKLRPFVADILYYVINTRYSEERATIFTTNYFDVPANPTLPTLVLRVGDAIRSRLHEMTEEIRLTNVPDYRVRAKNTL